MSGMVAWAKGVLMNWPRMLAYVGIDYVVNQFIRGPLMGVVPGGFGSSLANALDFEAKIEVPPSAALFTGW